MSKAHIIYVSVTFTLLLVFAPWQIIVAVVGICIPPVIVYLLIKDDDLILDEICRMSGYISDDIPTEDVSPSQRSNPSSTSSVSSSFMPPPEIWNLSKNN